MKILVDNYPEVFNLVGLFNYPDSALVPVNAGGTLLAFFAGTREYEWNPKTFHKDGLGTFAFAFRDGVTLASPARDIEESLVRANGRPRKAIEPDYSPLGTEHLIAPAGGFFDGERAVLLCQQEDRFNAQGADYLEANGRSAAYGRGAIARSTSNGFYFRRPRELFLEHWQDEATVFAPGETNEPSQQPQGLEGVVVLSTVYRDGFYYTFYTRFIDTRKQNFDPALRDSFGYPPGISRIDPVNPARYFGANLCVARSEDLREWKKYHGGTWAQDGIGGLDEGLLPVNAHYGSIAYSDYLGRYLYIAHTTEWGAIVFQSENLTDWAVFQELKDLGKPIYYPSFVSADGTRADLVGREGFIFYAVRFPGRFGRHDLRMVRRKFFIA